MASTHTYPCGETPEVHDRVESIKHVDRVGGEVDSLKLNDFGEVVKVKVRWDAIESFGNHSTHAPHELKLITRA